MFAPGPPWSQNWFWIFFVYHVRLGVVPFFGNGNLFRKKLGPKKCGINLGTTPRRHHTRGYLIPHQFWILYSNAKAAFFVRMCSCSMRGYHPQDLRVCVYGEILSADTSILNFEVLFRFDWRYWSRTMSNDVERCRTMSNALRLL